MLFGIHPATTPELLSCLAMMGHGDELVIADANFPSYAIAASTTFGDVIEMPNSDAAGVADLIAALMPLDSPAFAEHGVLRMQIDAKPDTLADVHKQVFAALKKRDQCNAGFGSIERQDFYKRARKSFAIIRTTETRGYGCFILRKGVILSG